MASFRASKVRRRARRVGVSSAVPQTHRTSKIAMMKSNGALKEASGLATGRLISAIDLAPDYSRTLHTRGQQAVARYSPPFHEIDLMRHLAVDACGGRCDGVAGMHLWRNGEFKGGAFAKHLPSMRQAQRTP